MREIFINEAQLKREDLDFTVVRVKGLIVNSKEEILLAHNNNTYQFPGGHLDEGESLEKCLKREVKEETGINIEKIEPPFLKITTFYKNYFDTGKNVKSIIYYYSLFTDDMPNFAETQYDSLEIQSDFNLLYINLKDLPKFLLRSKEVGTTDKDIAKEMLYALEEYEKVGMKK